MKNVFIELGGRRRELRFETWGIMQVEKELNLPIRKALEDEKVATVITLLWGSLLHRNKRLTLEQVASWVNIADGDAVKGLVEAVSSAFLLANGIDPDELKAIDAEQEDLQEKKTKTKKAG